MIKNDSPIPKYTQIKEILSEKITGGELNVGEQLPAEKSLADQYGVNRLTVRRAMKDLIEDGLILRVHGKGTFVNDWKDGEHHRSPCFLGVIIPEASEDSSPFISNFLVGIKSVASEEKYPLLLYTESESDYLSEIPDNGISGFIVTDPQEDDPRIARLKSENIPFVVIGRINNGDEMYTVDNDNVSIGHMLTNHLIESGCEKVGFLNGPMRLTVSQDRFEGYKSALVENGLSLDRKIVKYGEFEKENGYRNALELVSKGVDGLMCFDDIIAAGALRALQEKNLEVPADIALAGCNNSPFTQHTHPPLTTVNIFPDKLGQEGARKLIGLLQNGDLEKRTFVDARLVERESTRRREMVKR